MGLDTSHDCWHGPYSAFGRWRRALCEAAGLGRIDDREGFGGSTPWPSEDDDVIVALLYHSDCDGELDWRICYRLADRLESLVPAMRERDARNNYYGPGSFSADTEQFVNGLRRAHKQRENVVFR